MLYIESFFWGVLSAMGALAIELVVFLCFSLTDIRFIPEFSQLFILPSFIIMAALVEEIFKYIAISKRLEKFSTKKMMMLSSLFVGFGFFISELALISITGQFPTGRILTEIAAIHIGTAGIIGYYTAIKNPNKLSNVILTLAIVTFFHSTYNLLNIDRDVIEKYVILLVIGAIIFFNVTNFYRINRQLVPSEK